MKIPVKIDFKSNGKACKVLLNGETMATGKGPSIEFETPDLEPRRLQALTMVGEFEAPVWRWYIEWIQHDNSYFRKLSKNHQGFLPL